MKKSRLLGAVCAVLVSLITPSGLLAANGYTIIDLGTLGGTQSRGWAINNARQVVGPSYSSDSEWRAFLWDAVNGMQDLGTLGGKQALGLGINDAGQAVGHSYITGDIADHVFLWDAVNGMQDLGTLGGTNSRGLGINDAGQVVGESQITGDSATHVFLWDAVNGMQDLGTLGGTYSSGGDINDAGQVAGTSKITGNSYSHAFLWDAVNGMQDLGTLGGTNSSGRGINDAGQVAGSSADHAFLWDAVNGMQDLGTLGGTRSSGWGINEAGQVVGYSRINGDSAFYAFLWDAVNGMQDLCVLVDCVSAGWTILNIAYDINNQGDITGQGVINGQEHAFIIINNKAPIAFDTNTSADQFVVTNWTPDVSDADDDTLICTIVSQPPANQGIASVSSDCSTGTYDPQGFAGPSTSFTYKANDGTVDSNIATVTVTITPNPAPVAEDTAMSAISDTPKTLDLSPYISDGSGDQDLSTLTISTAAINGTAISNGEGTVTYTSNSGFTGPDTFGYTVDDAFGQRSNEGTVSVSVSLGIPPIADPGGPYAGIVGSAITFDGRGSSDLDGRVVSYEWDFGDGSTGTGFKPKHTYAYGSFYTVTLRVTDNDGDISLPATTIAMVSYIDGDSDNDGLPDDIEDANGNGNVEPGETDPFNADTDGDGLTDGYEVNVLGSDPITTTTLLPGDMNGDGVINAGDSVLHMREVLGY